MNKLFAPLFLGFLVVGITQSAFAAENPEGKVFSGAGADKDKDRCEKEAKTKATANALAACEKFCAKSGQGVSSFSIKAGKETATCAIDRKGYSGSGTVMVETCKCTNFISDPIITEVR